MKWLTVVEILALGLWTFYLVVWTRQLMRLQQKLTKERAALFGEQTIFEMRRDLGR